MGNSYTTRLKKRLPALGDENWDDEWHDNERLDEVVMGALLSANRVISGGAVSAGTGLNANYAAMEVLVAGVTYAIAAGSIGLTAASAGGELGNWISVSNAGAVIVSILAPDGDYVPLARVDTSETAVIRISDLRPAAPVIHNFSELLAEEGAARSLTGKNLVVNGSCQISQVNGTTAITAVDGGYLVDNCKASLSQPSKLTAQQIATTGVQLGATHVQRMLVASSYTPLDNDYFTESFYVEGKNMAHLKWGYAGPSAVSLQFNARSSVPGTYSGSLRNAAGDRSYPFSFTLSAAFVNQIVKIENIPCCADGVWETTNTMALRIVFDLGCGSNFKTTAGAWVSGQFNGVTGATAFVSLPLGSTLQIGDIQLEKGSVCTTFERKSFGQDLMECQRYYYEIGPVSSAGLGTEMAGASQQLHLLHPVPMRAAPTIVYSDDQGTATSVQYRGAGGSTLSRGPVDFVSSFVGHFSLSDYSHNKSFFTATKVTFSARM